MQVEMWTYRGEVDPVEDIDLDGLRGRGDRRRGRQDRATRPTSSARAGSSSTPARGSSARRCCCPPARSGRSTRRHARCTSTAPARRSRTPRSTTPPGYARPGVPAGARRLLRALLLDRSASRLAVSDGVAAPGAEPPSGAQLGAAAAGNARSTPDSGTTSCPGLAGSRRARGCCGPGSGGFSRKASTSARNCDRRVPARSRTGRLDRDRVAGLPWVVARIGPVDAAGGDLERRVDGDHRRRGLGVQADADHALVFERLGPRSERRAEARPRLQDDRARVGRHDAGPRRAGHHDAAAPLREAASPAAIAGLGDAAPRRRASGNLGPIERPAAATWSVRREAPPRYCDPTLAPPAHPIPWGRPFPLPAWRTLPCERAASVLTAGLFGK